jgi:hypothetical protein
LGNIKQDNEGLGLLLFLNQISQWLGVHKGTFQEDGGNNLSSQRWFAQVSNINA